MNHLFFCNPRRFLHSVFLTLVFVFYVYTPAEQASSQVIQTVKAKLTSKTSSLYIGPLIYLSYDKDRTLTYNAAIARHLNNQRGTRNNDKIIALDSGNDPVWIIFSVENRSDKKNWVLDFGTLSYGRYALAKRLLVRNHSQGQTFVRALQENPEKTQIKSLQGPAVSLSIPPQESSLFVIYLEPEGSTPNTIVPRLITSEQYAKELRHKSLFYNTMTLFLASMVVFFFTLYYLRKNLYYILFSFYYFLLAALFLVLDNFFYTGFQGAGLLLEGLFLSTLALGLLMSIQFLELDESYGPERFLPYAGLATIIIGLALGSLGLQSFYVITVFAVIGILIFLAMLQSYRGVIGAPHFAAAWLFVLGGIVISLLGFTQILDANLLVINAFWLSLAPQGLIFASGAIKKINVLEAQEQKLQLQEVREAQTVEKLKQTKENTDQARLLRVIERERQVMADLREKDRRRAEDMRLAMEQADEASRAKSAFLAVVSHEIRTPMTGIMGMVKLLLNTKLSPEQNDYVLAVQKSGDSMMTLLNDILDFEKIESGNMELENIDFDLPRLINGVVTLMSGQASEKNIYLKTDIPADIPQYVKGDPTRLRQVILNLTNNAIKFTDKGGITIHLRATKLEKKIGNIRADYEIYVAIEDTGIGISEDVQENLFSPFAQAETSTTRKYGGTGLGLAICKKLIEAMGSTIRVTSEKGTGSTFYFTLLMEAGHKEMVEDNATDHQETGSVKPLDILVVEDNIMNQRVFTGLLEKHGHSVTTADSGEEALEKLKTEYFDVIISDVSMRGISGIEMTRKIRKLGNRRKAAIPVIALTGNVQKSDIESYYEANMNGFLAKPVDPDKLATTIEKLSREEMDNPVQVEEPDPSEDLELDMPDTDEFISNPENTDPAESQEKENKPDQSKKPFDENLLSQLIDSLGTPQFKNLIDDYIIQSDLISETIEDIIEKKDIAALREKAHEMKGMAANFGMTEVSRIAARGEDFATEGDLEKAIEVLKKLTSVNKTTNESLKSWIEKQS